MATIYRYRFDGIAQQTIRDVIGSMGSDGSGLVVASVPSSVFIDISIPDGFDVTLVDALFGYPYKWTRVGIASTPNVRVATIRVKRNAAFSVSDSYAQLAWDAVSTLSPAVAIDLTSGDMIPLVTGLMRVDLQAIVGSLLGLASVTTRVTVNPGGSQVVVCESPPMGSSAAACNVQFGITAGIPVRIEVKKSGGIGGVALFTSEILTFCCANVIVG